MTHLTRGRVVLLIAAAAALALVSALPTWVRATVGQGVGVDHVRVAGSTAAPALVPLGLVLGAGAFALTLADGVARRVVAAVVALAGAGLVAATAQVLAAPRSAAHQAQVGAATTTGAPLIALVAGVLACVAGALALTAGRRWPKRPARTGTTTPTPTARSDWDALSAGEDPT